VPVNITGSQSDPVEVSRRLSTHACGVDGITRIIVIAIILLIPATPCHLMLATGVGNAPVVRVRTAKTVQFGSNPAQQTDHVHRGGQTPGTYPSCHPFNRVWLDSSVPISVSGIRVFLFMVPLR
jgi:hypothetical protein